MYQKIKFFTCLLAVALLLTGCSCENKKATEETKKNEKPTTEETTKVLEDTKVEELKISGFNITFKDGISTVVATVTNESKETINLTSLSLLLYDKDHKLIVETAGNVGETIKPGESKQFNTLITEDVRNTEKVEYKIIK